ncbi:MAG: ATP-binding protein [Alicyclobacillaceae bacterium]|nr:ATP-binding protein [Alicyclobacillaceae bacterium]
MPASKPQWILWDTFEKDPAVTAAHRWMETGEEEEAVAWVRHLVRFATAEQPVPLPPDASLWKSYLLHRMLFSPLPAPLGQGAWEKTWQAALARDLRQVCRLWHLDCAPLLETLKMPKDALHPAETGQAISGESGRHNPYIQWLAGEMAYLYRRLEEAQDWAELAGLFHAAYRRIGTGLPGRYWVFKWEGPERGLVPVESPDPISLGDLVGYEAQRRQVLQNTEQFVKGYPANNVLLYGDRGTGKSSLVKALVHEFGPQGLRLVEVSRRDLGDFPDIVRILRRYPQKFILFLDDLSFDEGETMYKDLKTLLEGGVERRPDNVLLYATSNRRHLVKEQFSDRTWPVRREDSDDLHLEDTIQEKLSLADRFGLTVAFLAPSQELFLDMVRHMAESANLPVDQDELRRRALQWERRHNGRSGRSARQFVDQLAGELALKKEKQGAF